VRGESLAEYSRHSRRCLGFWWCLIVKVVVPCQRLFKGVLWVWLKANDAWARVHSGGNTGITRVLSSILFYGANSHWMRAG